MDLFYTAEWMARQDQYFFALILRKLDKTEGLYRNERNCFEDMGVRFLLKYTLFAAEQNERSLQIGSKKNSINVY